VQVPSPDASGQLARESGEALLERYAQTGDRRCRERAIEQHMPLARRLALRYARGGEPLDDLLQVAYLGLVNAIDRFDPARGTRFASFAVPTITGELRRHFRSTSWRLHVPRGVQENTLRVRNATERLTHQLGRAPTTGELGEETGLGVEEIADALNAQAVQATASLDGPWGENEGETTLGDVVGTLDDRYDVVEHFASIAPLLRRLPARQREVLVLRFVQDLTQSEIATRVGCSQMQVSRLLRRAVATLSAQVERQAGHAPALRARPPG
jgi:RNA polymerase sigma-B factor